MKNHVGIVIAVGSLFLSGCIGQIAPSQRLDSAGINVILAAAKLPEVDAEKAKKMTSLGPVTGYSCKNKPVDPEPTKEGAADQAKIFAVIKGATAITNMFCKEHGFSLITNCFYSWQCDAVALK